MEDRSRVILLNGEITEESAMTVIIQLLEYERQNDKREISLYINSPGGSVPHGLAIYDTIKHIKAPVATVCYGMCASMGAFLLTCGKKGKRYALPNSRVLIHQPLVPVNNATFCTQTEMQRMADSMLQSRNELERIMAENIGKDVAIIHADCERDNWMSAQEALEYGIIDKVLKGE